MKQQKNGKEFLRRAMMGVIALCTVSAVHAQSSSVIYGQIDVGMRYVANYDGQRSLGYMSSSGLSATYIGFKGTEDLGSIGQAFYKLENQFSADNGAIGAIGSGTSLFGRESLVGLNGDWGSLSLGRQYNALNIFFAYNPVWVDGASPIYVAGDNMLLGYRMDNSAVYKKQFGRLAVQLDYAMGEQAGSTQRGQTYGGNVSYNFDNAMLGAGFDEYHTANGIDVAKNWTVGGRLKLGDSTSLYLGHLGSNTQGNSSINRRLTWLGLQEQATERLLLASGIYWYKQSACIGTCTAGQTVNQGGNGSKIMGFSSGAGAGHGQILAAYARYSLSKRTSLYLEMDRYMLRNGAAQDQLYYWTGTVNKSTSSLNQTAVMAGITHSF